MAPVASGPCSMGAGVRFSVRCPPEPGGLGIHLAVPQLMSDSPCSPRGCTPGPAPAPSGAGSKSQSPRSLTARRVTPGQQEAPAFPDSGWLRAGVWLCRWCHGPGVFGSSQPGVQRRSVSRPLPRGGKQDG